MKSKENHSRKKLNIVDYCVIVLLVAVLALVGWKKFESSPAESTASGPNPISDLIEDPSAASAAEVTRRIRFDVLCSDNPTESVQFLIDSQNKQLNYDGKIIDASITNVELIPHYISEGFASPVRTDSRITIEAEAVFSAQGIYVDTQRLSVGASFAIRTSLVYLNGTVLNMEVLDD